MEPDKPSTPPSAPPPLHLTDKITRQPGTDMLEAGERLITIVRRHPIGIVGIYLEVLVGLIAVVAVFASVAPDTFKDLGGGASAAVLLSIVLGLAVLIFFLFVATYVYRQSRLLITDRGIIEVKQTSLFIRKVARLSFSNVEDVSAERRGILSTIFNYGTLLVQTAGALDNFEFKYCPDPSRYADIIIEAREAYAQALREDKEHP